MAEDITRKGYEMNHKKTSKRRMIWMLLGGTCGLALVIGLLLVAQLTVRAEPAADPTGVALTVEKTANTDVADAGDTLTYTVKIEKAGAYTTAAWLTDSLPAELTFTGGLTARDSFGDPIGTVGAQNDVITWYEPSLAGNVWITYSAQISPEAEVEDIINVAQVTGTGELITSSWETRIGGGLLYFPMVFKRWPPVPYAPTLNEVQNPDWEGDYTVSWAYGYGEPPVNDYTLQEATNSDFTENVTEYSAVGTSRAFTDKGAGKYYYRVRGNNTYGPGPWSNVRSVSVAFRDDFDDSSTGWEARRTSAPDIDDMEVKYDNGRLVTRSEDNYDFGLFSPMVEAPPPPYEIRMRTRLRDGVYVPAYGIVFGGEAEDFCPVERDDADDDDGCFFHYYRVNVTVNKWGGHIDYEVKRIDEHGDRGEAEGKDLSDGYRNIDGQADWDGWNNWRIEVYEDRFRLYVNGDHLGTYRDDRYTDDPLFGILTSNYEFSPAVFEHEYFYVEPLN